MSLRISRQHWQALLEALADAQRQRNVLTYRSLIERIGLPAPAMQTLAKALEYLAALDARAARPLRSALVVSQSASRLPRPGFFEHVARLGLFAGDASGAAAWHAVEVVKVFEYEYPDDD